MKKIFPILLLFAVVLSCVKKEEVKPVKKESSIDASVGTDENGKYIFADSDSLKYKWNVFVNKKMKPQDSIALDDFSIIKTKTKGDTSEDCYLLIARAKDQKVSVGAVLELKDKKFYTNFKDASGFDVYEVILCTGGCGDSICNPHVVVAGGIKRLICSSCDQCIKVSGSIN